MQIYTLSLGKILVRLFLSGSSWVIILLLMNMILARIQE